MIGYIWFAGGMVLTMLTSVMQWGPFGWMAAAQQRSSGTNNAVFDMLPMAVLWLAPLILGNWLHRLTGLVVFAGMRQAIDRLSTPPASNGKMAPRAAVRRLFMIFLAMGVGGVVFAVGGPAVVLATTGQGAGEPLPTLDYAGVVDRNAHWPSAVRLAGVAEQTDEVWVHRYVFRSDRHRDRYTPLAPPGQAAGAPVRLLVEDVVFVDGDDSQRRPSPVLEGTLAADAVPGWMIEEMRRSGIPVSDHPVVLKRDDLHGVRPGPDLIGAFVWGVPGFALAIVGLAMAWQIRRQMRRIVD